MRLCALDIEESIQIEAVNRVRQKVNKYLESGTSVSLIRLNQAGQSVKAVGRAVKEVNDSFGDKVIKIAFDESGQKYLDINPNPAFVDKIFTKYLEREDARDAQRADAERAGVDYNDWYLFKLKGNDNQATLDQVKAAKEWWDKSPLSKNIALQEAFNVVNSNALAQWTGYGITLFHGANYTDVYHEAFHGFTQLYLTKKQKASLYNEARKVLGQKLSDFEVEETLAEDFRKYVLSDGKKVLDQRPERNTIFRKLLRFLKQLFGGVSAREAISKQTALDTIQEMYDNLYKGHNLNLKPSIDNAQFGLLNKGLTGIEDKATSLTYQQSLAVVEAIDFFIAEALDKNNLPVSVLFSTEEALNIVYDIALSGLKSVRSAIAEAAESTIDPLERGQLIEKIEALDFAINNYGDVVSGSKRGATGTIAYHKKKSKYLDFKVSAKNLDDILDIDENDVADYTQLFDRTGTEGSLVDYADPVILYTLRSIKSDSTNYFGLPKLHQGIDVFKRVARLVSGAKLTEQQMYQKLISSKDPMLNQVAQKLGDPSVLDTDSRLAMWSKFFQTFNKYKIPVMEMVHVEDGENTYDTYGQAVGDSLKIEKDWQRVFVLGQNGNGETNLYVSKTAAGTVLNVTKLNEDFKSITHDNIYDFLQAIGIQLDDTAEVRESLRAFTNRVNTYILPAIKKVYSADSKSPDFQGITDVVKLLKTERKDIGIEGNAGLVKELAELARKTSAKIHMGQVQGATNNPINEFSLNNSLTEIIGALNDPTKTYQDVVKMPHMAAWDITKNPLLKGNMILGSIFNLDTAKEFVLYRDPKTGNTTKVNFGERFPGAKIELTNFNGVKVSSDAGVFGVATTDLSPYDKFIFEFNSFLSSGDVELMRHASKSSAYSVKASRILSKYNAVNSHLYIDINRFSDARGNQAATELIKRHVANEVARALTVRNENINIPGYSEKAKDLVLFGELLGKEITDKLFNLDYNQDILSQINADLDLSEAIDKVLVKYLVENAQRNAKIFEKVAYKSSNLRNISNVSTDVAIAAYTANSLIHNLEVLSLLYGDAASYNHAKEDFHKRNAGIASTGDVHSMNKAAHDRITNNGFVYAKALAEKEGFTVTPFDGTLNVAVLEDVVQDLEITNEDAWKEYVSALTKAGMDPSGLQAYKEINASDGQGYISFDFYKASRELLGKWTPQQEALYQKIAKGEPVDPKKIMKTFPPLKYQYFGPMKTEKLSVYSFHKFSLLPLVPSVVKGTNLELLHNQMVRQNVHYVTFKSGSKLADGNAATTFVDNDGKFVEGNLNPYQVFLPFLKDQVNVSDEFKEEVKFSTQLRKLILQHLYDGGKPVSKKAERLAKQYESLIEKQVQLKLEKLYSELGIAKIGGTYTTVDATKLLTYLKERLEKRNLPEHVVDYVEQAVNGNIKSALDFSLSSNEIEKALYSIVANDVVRTKVNGESLVQVSGVGFEKQGVETDSKLKFYRQSGGVTQAMEVKIPLQGKFKELLKLKHNDGADIRTLERLNEMLGKQSFKALYKEMLQMIAVRIPVQGHNSMEFMQVVEFLPEEGGISIVLPYEITAKSGGDFDIDKLTIMMPNIRVKDGVIDMDFSDSTIEGVENSIIQSVAEILESEENFVHLIRPNSTDLVKPLADELKQAGVNKKFDWNASPIRIIETGYNLYKHESNAVGKKTLGIGAVDNTNNTLMNRTGFSLNATMFFGYGKKAVEVPAVILLPHNKSEKGEIFLDKLKTVNNESIGETISQLINGWVDVEKDAWVSEIQGNDIAGPVLLFMVQSGVPVSQAIKFLSNPLVKQYVDTLKIYRSPFSKNSNLSRNKQSGYAAAEVLQNVDREGIEPLLAKLTSELYKVDSDYPGSWNVPENFSEDRLNAMAFDQNEDKEAFIHFLQLEAMSKVLTNVKLSSNFDTKTFNSSFAVGIKTQASVSAYDDQHKLLSEKTITGFRSNAILNSFRNASVSQLSAWNFFAVRNNPSVSNFMIKMFGYGNNDANINNALSQIFTAIYQDALLGADLSVVDYKGIPVKKVTLEAGVAFKDGVLYVDPVQIQNDLRNINSAQRKLGRASLNAQAFNFRTLNGAQSFDQYYNFLLEREYLRSKTAKLDSETQEQYETKLRDAALRGSNNLWYMFSSSSEAQSYAATFVDILDKHPQLLQEYSVLGDIVMDRKNGVDRLKMSTRITDSDVLNAYHENLKALSDPTVQKVTDPKENKKISDFFGRFVTVAFLQNGFTSGQFNLAKIAPDTNYSEVMQNFIESKKDNLESYLTTVLEKLLSTPEVDAEMTPVEMMKASAKREFVYRTSLNNYLTSLQKEETYQEFLDKTNVSVRSLDYMRKNPLTLASDKKVGYLIPVPKNLQKAADTQKNIASFPYPSEVSLEQFRDGIRAAFEKLQYLNSEGISTVIDESLYSQIFVGKPEYYNVLIEEFRKVFNTDPLNLTPSAAYREAVQVSQEITDQDVLDQINACK